MFKFIVLVLIITFISDSKTEEVLDPWNNGAFLFKWTIP